jgi:uncharacterized protein
MVEVKIDAIRVNMSNSRAVILKAIDANRYLTILIGEPEANAIAIQLQGITTPRPITHDLVVGLAREMGATFRYVVINDMRETIYYATVILVNRDGREMRIDARPSDAIALAVRGNFPIYVEDVIMNEYGQTPDEESPARSDEDLGAFTDFLGSLDLDDLDKK